MSALTKQYPDTIPGNVASSLPAKDEASEAVALARKIFQLVEKYILK